MTDEQPYQKLILDDTEYQTQYTRKFENRKAWKEPVAGSISAFLPGTVYEILVSEGDTVTEGTLVLRFEAMKMINDIQTPVSGKVAKIHVTKGDHFSKGAVLIEIV